MGDRDRANHSSPPLGNENHRFQLGLLRTEGWDSLTNTNPNPAPIVRPSVLSRMFAPLPPHCVPQHYLQQQQHPSLRHPSLEESSVSSFHRASIDNHNQRSPPALSTRSPAGNFSYRARTSPPSSSSIIGQRRSSIPAPGRSNSSSTRPSPYDRHYSGPRSLPSLDPPRYDTIEGVSQLSLEVPSMNENDEVEDRRKRGKTPPDMCAVCSCTSTAEWRKGPAGPRMLCNGCGLCAAKRAKERAAEGLEPISGEDEIWLELRAIGAERHKTIPEEYELPADTVERIRATRERTEQSMAASAASSQRLQKSRRRSGSRSTNVEREAAASLVGLRRASVGNDTQDQVRIFSTFSDQRQQMTPRQSPPMLASASFSPTRRTSTPQLPRLSSSPGPSSEYSARRDSLPLPLSSRPFPFHEHRHSQNLPPISHMLPPHYYQSVIPPPYDPNPGVLPNLNRRHSLLDAWRERTGGAPLPFLREPTPPISVPDSSVRSTMMTSSDLSSTIDTVALPATAAATSTVRPEIRR